MRAILELAKEKKLVYLLLKNLPASWQVPNVVKYDTPKKLYDAQITEDGALGEFFDELALFWQKEKTPSKSPMRSCLKNKESPGASSQQDGQLSRQISDSDSPARKKARFSYSDSHAVTHDSLVVCFDEVSALQDSALRPLRRAGKHLGILTIFSDTAASICKVMKPNDHSSKAKGGTLGRFVSPIFSLKYDGPDLGVRRRI